MKELCSAVEVAARSDSGSSPYAGLAAVAGLGAALLRHIQQRTPSASCLSASWTVDQYSETAEEFLGQSDEEEVAYTYQVGRG